MKNKIDELSQAFDVAMAEDIVAREEALTRQAAFDRARKYWHTTQIKRDNAYQAWQAAIKEESEKGKPAEPVKKPASGLDTLQVEVYTVGVACYTKVTIERCEQYSGPDLWAIRWNSFCLNDHGEWRLEPRPSIRDEEFIKNHRWPTAESALDFLRDVEATKWEALLERTGQEVTE